MRAPAARNAMHTAITVPSQRRRMVRYLLIGVRMTADGVRRNIRTGHATLFSILLTSIPEFE